MIKVLPVYPKFPPSFWSYRYAIDLIGKKAIMPPLGLITVCAMLPRDKFESMPVADLNVRDLRDEEIKEADIVFASSMVTQKDSLKEVVDRAHFFGKKVVAGGPYPTSYHGNVPGDFFVLGEAEVTLKPFLEDLIKNCAGKVYDEKIYSKRIPSETLTKGGKPLLTQTPIPRWDLLNPSAYASGAVQFSRGCRFNCEFCYVRELNGGEPRAKTPEQMIREMETIRTNGWSGSVMIVDDNILLDTIALRKTIPLLTSWQKDHGFPYTFSTQASLDLSSNENKDILNGMVKAGFDSVFLGVESFDPAVLKKMHKAQNSSGMGLLEKIEVVQRAGLDTLIGAILGADGENPKASEQMFESIQKAGVVISMVGKLNALPDTKLYARLKKEERLLDEVVGDNVHSSGFNFVTQSGNDYLNDRHSELQKKLFESKNYYDRCRILGSRRGQHHSDDRFNLGGLVAAGKLLYENSVQFDYEFFKYISEVTLKNPWELGEAFAQAAKLRHFKKMTEHSLEVVKFTKSTETLYASFQARMSELSGDARRKISEFEAAEKEIMRKAEKSYEKLHEDFRQSAKTALNNLDRKIREYKDQYILSQSSLF